VTRSFRYPIRALCLDYAGSGVGLATSLGLIVFIRMAEPVAWVVTAVAALFLVYFGRTVCRQLTRIELDEGGIRAVGPAWVPSCAAIRWEDLRSLRLDYYSTRRDPEGMSMQGGWMQLKLRDARRTIRIDSDVDGFAELVRAAAHAAARRDLALDPATASNLEAMRF
jgi:hypothetical protein